MKEVLMELNKFILFCCYFMNKEQNILMVFLNKSKRIFKHVLFQFGKNLPLPLLSLGSSIFAEMSPLDVHIWRRKYAVSVPGGVMDLHDVVTCLMRRW
jgi:hypothetical protein